MTVAELMRALERANPEATVLLYDEYGIYTPSEVWTDYELNGVRVQ